MLRYRYNFWYRWEMADSGIGMNLRLGIGIWYRYRYEFWVSVSGIGIGLNFGYRYRYRYGSSAGYRYRYQGIGGTLGEIHISSWKCSSSHTEVSGYNKIHLLCRYSWTSNSRWGDYPPWCLSYHIEARHCYHWQEIKISGNFWIDSSEWDKNWNSTQTKIWKISTFWIWHTKLQSFSKTFWNWVEHRIYFKRKQGQTG